MATATAPRLTRLLEICTSGTANVDREAGVIRNVKVLGTVSKNGRTYSRACLAKARGLYEGCKVNINHPNRSTPMADRGILEQFGWLQNVRLSDGGLFADLHYLKSHPDACHVIERAERNPQLIGLSHNAEGRTEMRNGKTMVEDISHVNSVDLVTSPASTNGLFEAMDGGNFVGDTAPTPLDAANLLKRAREMMIETIRISGTPSVVKTFDDVLQFLLATRDGTDSPDRFYLGELPGKSGRFAARLDSFHSIEVPSDENDRNSFLTDRRIGRLNAEFARDLHVRLFRAFASLGFDDVGWLSDRDLQWVVETGRADLAGAKQDLHEKKASQSKSEFDNKSFPTKQIDGAEKRVTEMEGKLAEFEAELVSRREKTSASIKS